MHDRSSADEAILIEALALPAESRRAYVLRRCDGDTPSASRVIALLDGFQENSAFLETPAAAAALQSAGHSFAPIPPEPEPGDRINRYHLLQRIGEGGFGVVYLAEQEEPMRRLVALKVIRLGLDTREFIVRFEVERQALAVMDHPNIARVFDAGATDNGRPYLVMELIRGIPITAYCDEHKLPVSARLGLFLQVCNAIQHAHQKGVIHCDLKPSNILIELHGPPEAGSPKVIDFGIAKATPDRRTDQTLFTRFHALIGTPAYTSPEQMELSGRDVDTRSDIYSLGVLLYELLTGHQPFEPDVLEHASLEEMRRLIREVDPPRPSVRVGALESGDRMRVARRRGLEPEKLLPLLRSDLDWIVMRCLEKDRTRRYETANGLAMDLRRHLACEPVVARPPSRAYQLGKFVRRNRTGVIAGTVVAFALVTGLVLAAVGFAGARLQRYSAETARREAEDLVSFMVKDLKPELQRAGRLPLTARVAERAVRYFSNLPPNLNNPSTERNRAIALEVLAYARSYAGNSESAVALWHEALAARRRAAAGAPHDPLIAVELTHTEFVDVARDWPLILSRAPGGPESPGTDARLEGIVKQAQRVFRGHQDDHKVSRIYAQVLGDWSRYLSGRPGRATDALAVGREAEVLYRDFLARSSNDTTLDTEFLHLQAAISSAVSLAGDFEAGIHVAEESLAFADRELAKNPRDTELRENAAFAAMQLSFRFSCVLPEKSNAAEAVARERWRVLVEADPQNIYYRHQFAWAHSMEPNFLFSTGRTLEARDAAARYIGLLAPVAQSPTDFQTLRMMTTRLGVMEAEFGDATSARTRLVQSREWQTRYLASLGPKAAQQPSVRVDYLDEECALLGGLAEWLELELAARALVATAAEARRLDPNDTNVLMQSFDGKYWLGRALLKQGMAGKAVPILQDVVRDTEELAARRLPGTDFDGPLLEVKNLLGESLRSAGDVQQSRDLLEKNLTAWEKFVTQKPTGACDPHQGLAECAFLLSTALDSSAPQELARRQALLERAATILESRIAGNPLNGRDSELLAKINALRVEERSIRRETAASGGTPR